MKKSDSKTKIKMLDYNEKEFDSGNNYKIYNYFKENTSFFIASVTIFVGFISALFQFIIYIFKQFELSMWNISMSEFDLSITQNYYYSIIICISICFIGIFSIAFLTHYCQKVLVFYARYIYLKEYIKQYKYKIENEQNSKNNNLISVRKLRLKKYTKDIEDDIKNIKHNLGIIIFIDLMITIICLLLMVTINRHITKNQLFELFLWVLVISILLTVYILYETSKKITKIKTIRNEAKTICEAKNFSLLNKKRKLLILKNKFHFKDMLDDKKIKQTLSALLLLTLVYCLYIPFTIIQSMNAQQSIFWIYSDTNGTYAVVYNESNKYVLKEAEIDDDKLYINLSNQRIIESKDMTMEQMSFDEVIKVDSKNYE